MNIECGMNNILLELKKDGFHTQERCAVPVVPIEQHVAYSTYV